MSDKQHRQLRFPRTPEGIKQSALWELLHRTVYTGEQQSGAALSKRKQHLLFGIILDLNLTQPTNVKDILESLASV